MDGGTRPNHNSWWSTSYRAKMEAIMARKRLEEVEDQMDRAIQERKHLEIKKARHSSKSPKSRVRLKGIEEVEEPVVCNLPD